MRTRLVAVLSSLALALGATAVLGALTAAPASAATQIIPVPTSAAGLGRIVTAPNGTIWFAERDANKVGRFTPGGAISEVSFPADFDSTIVKDLAVAPDSSVWVLYQSGRNVAHLDANGTVLATGNLPQFGQTVRVTPDGTVWITISYDEQYVVRISGGSITELPNSPECQDSLGVGADGAVWCRTSSGLTRLGGGGGGTTYPANNYAAYPYAIAAGPVGSIWFGRYFGGTFISSPDDGEVGYLDAASGAVTAFDTGERTAPNDLVRGPDGNMWFNSIGAAKGIGHLAPNGTGGALHQVGGYAPNSLTFGNDGFVYAADAANNVIIKVSTDELQTTNVDPGAGSVLTGTAAAASSVGTAKVGKRPVALRRGAVPVRIACPKVAPSACTGKARLVTTAKRKPTSVSRTVKYKIATGKKKSLSLRLSAKGLRAVPRHGAATFRLQLLTPGSKEPVSVKTVKVRR